MRVKTATISTNYELSGPKNAPVVMLSHALGCKLSTPNVRHKALTDRA